MGKLGGTAYVPLITAALAALLLSLPRLDPLQKNDTAFRDWYYGFIPAFVLFMPASGARSSSGAPGIALV